MTDEFGFTPRLGRPGNLGRRAARGYLARIRRSVARKAASSGSNRRATGFKGHRLGKGAGIGARARTRRGFGQRRVIVKVHIARAGKGGTAGFGKHVTYIRRDSAQREAEPGHVYDRENNRADDASFNTRSEGDERQFRLIVSPEDGHDIEDMKAYTRRFMAQVEQDTGQRLDWVAADHHNTSHPHTHIVIRGMNRGGQQLILAKDYITHGLRARAEDILTRDLGLRRVHEIARARMREVTQDRLTGIDRAMAKEMTAGILHHRRGLGTAERFNFELRRKRLAHLETLGLAKPKGDGRWEFREDWQDKLKTLGKQGDIIRTLSAEIGNRLQPQNLHVFDPEKEAAGTVTGRLAAIGPGDELRNGRTILIDGTDGRQWSLQITETQADMLPARGGIVSLVKSAPELKPADRTIAKIAKANGGKYSDALHNAFDPSASQAFKLAHKRRLEVLRRARLVKRSSDGIWTIPATFEADALTFEKRKSGARIVPQTWLNLDALVEHEGTSWLDRIEPGDLAALGPRFGAELRQATQQRRNWLISQGLMHSSDTQIPETTRKRMEKLELDAALARQAAKFRKVAMVLGRKGQFDGVYTHNADLAQGRFAVVQSDKAVTLVRWRSGLAAHRGRALSLSRSGRTVNWQLSDGRGHGR